MDQTSETLRNNGGGDGVDVTSWVSVCPRGLCKVQQKRSGEWALRAVATSGDGPCMMFLCTSLSQFK